MLESFQRMDSINQEVEQLSDGSGYQPDLLEKQAEIEAYLREHDTWRLNSDDDRLFIENMLFAGEASVYDKLQQTYVTMILVHNYSHFYVFGSEASGSGGSDFLLPSGLVFFQISWIT